MQSILIGLQLWVADRAQQVLRRQEGQTTAEYVGVILLLAAVAGLIAGTGWGSRIASSIGRAISTAIGSISG
jgi:hypothetical protein